MSSDFTIAALNITDLRFIISIILWGEIHLNKNYTFSQNVKQVWGKNKSILRYAVNDSCIFPPRILLEKAIEDAPQQNVGSKSKKKKWQDSRNNSSEVGQMSSPYNEGYKLQEGRLLKKEMYR